MLFGTYMHSCTYIHICTYLHAFYGNLNLHRVSVFMRLLFVYFKSYSVVRGFLARRKCKKLRMEQRAAAATQLQRGQLKGAVCVV